MPCPQTPFPKPPAGSRRGRNGGGRFFNAQREGGALFSLRSCRRASRSFMPGVALSEPLLGVLSKHESGGVSLPRFLLQSKGEGRALRPCCEKSGGLFFKSPRLSCETRGLCAKSPVFWGPVYSARTKGTCRHSTLREGENRRGRVAWLSPAHEIYNAY